MVRGFPLAWRLDVRLFAPAWDKGIAAAEVGGRWNPVGYPVVYCSADPATAILEVAVPKGFPALDTVPHTLTRARVLDAADVHVVGPDDVPNPAWLRMGVPSQGQQAFGRTLLERHIFVAVPSAVTQYSWNLLFSPTRAATRYLLESQDRFALDPSATPLDFVEQLSERREGPQVLGAVGSLLGSNDGRSARSRRSGDRGT